jgi:hypothetical protein
MVYSVPLRAKIQASGRIWPDSPMFWGSKSEAPTVDGEFNPMHKPMKNEVHHRHRQDQPIGSSSS